MSRRNYLTAAILYFLIAIALFYPVIRNPAKTVLGVPSGDIYQFLFFIWWVKHALLTLHSSPYIHMSLLYWPIGVNSAILSVSPLTSMISIPFQSVSLPFAYNAVFFLGFVIAGLGAFSLTRYLVKEDYAAFLGGIFFAFSSSYMAGSATEFQLFGTGVMAFFLYFFLRSVNEKRPLFILLAGILLMAVAFTATIKEFIIAAFAAAIILAIMMIFHIGADGHGEHRHDRHSMLYGRPAIFLMILLIALISGIWGFAPLLHAYLSGYSTVTELSTVSYSVEHSVSLLSFFLPTYIFAKIAFQNPAMTHYNLLYASPLGGAAYIGYSLLLLAAYASIRSFKESRIWIACSLIFILLSLGPLIMVTNSPVTYGPYYVLGRLPILNAISEPQVFGELTPLFLAILGAIGFKKLTENTRLQAATRNKAILAAIISIVFILESFGMPYYRQSGTITTTPYAPTFLSSIANESGNFSFAVLPTSTIENYVYSGISDYYVTKLKRPSVTGLVTRLNSSEAYVVASVPLFDYLSCAALCGNESYPMSPYSSPISENYALQSIKMLQRYGVRYLIIENNAYGSDLNATIAYLTGIFGSPSYADKNLTVFSTSASESLLENTTIAIPLQGWISHNTTTGLLSTSGWTPYGRYAGIAVYPIYPKGGYSDFTIGFHASAAIPQSIGLLVYDNSSAPPSEYSIGLSRSDSWHSVNATLADGSGNLVEFISRYNGTAGYDTWVYINNITFSKS